MRITFRHTGTTQDAMIAAVVLHLPCAIRKAPRILRRRWPQRHEHPKDHDANYCHQDEIAVCFHYQCLLEALMAMLAIPMCSGDDLSIRWAHHRRADARWSL